MLHAETSKAAVTSKAKEILRMMFSWMTIAPCDATIILNNCLLLETDASGDPEIAT